MWAEFSETEWAGRWKMKKEKTGIKNPDKINRQTKEGCQAQC